MNEREIMVLVNERKKIEDKLPPEDDVVTRLWMHDGKIISAYAFEPHSTPGVLIVDLASAESEEDIRIISAAHIVMGKSHPARRR